MRIDKLVVQNFKSFDEQSFEFNNINIFIGANAAGKSNAISAIRFINNIIQYGIDDAISLLGGIHFATNINLKKEKPMRFEILFTLEDFMWRRRISKRIDRLAILTNIEYTFSLSQKLRGNGYKIIEDKCTLEYSLVPKECEDNEKHITKNDNVKFKYVIVKENSKYKTSIESNTTGYQDQNLLEDLGFKYLERLIKDEKDELILKNINLFTPPVFFRNDSIKIFDFDPKLLKKSSPIASKRSLEEDGSNLSIILQDVIKDKARCEKLTKIIKTCLPYVTNINIESNTDKSITLKLTEQFNSKALYSYFLSDGTVSILALIIALYFGRNQHIVVLEEPERNLHPQLMGKLMQMVNDVSSHKQIFITTHNPEILKHSDISDIYFFDRCEKGFSHANKIESNKKVIDFLKNELGIDELFLSGMLGE